MLYVLFIFLCFYKACKFVQFKRERALSSLVPRPREKKWPGTHCLPGNEAKLFLAIVTTFHLQPVYL